MTTSKFTTSAIVPELFVWGHYQRASFNEFNQSVKSQVYSEFVPTSLTDSIINTESRNHLLSGFRLKHTSTSTDVSPFGSFKFQSFIADDAGSDIFGFDGDNFNVYFPLLLGSNLDMGSYRIINLATPIAGTDAANKLYVDSAVAAGGGTVTLTGNVTGSGTVGTPFATTIVSTLNNIPIATGDININSQKLKSVGNVGLNVASPTFPLQFDSVNAQIKLCMRANTGNGYQDYGFGVTSFTLAYNVYGTGASHVFYAGTSSTTSAELFRIHGSGLLTATNTLNMSTNTITGLSMAGTPASTDAVNVSYLNTKIAAGTVVLTGNVTGSGTVGTSFATTIASTLNSIPVATGSVNLNSQNLNSVGNIGIGVAAPTFNLHLSNTINRSKICLWQNYPNDFQVYGFGILGSTLVYSVASTADSHVFYAGTSSTTSAELFRIHGSGLLTAKNTLNMSTNTITGLSMAGTPASTDAVNVSYLNTKIAAGTVVLTGNVTGSGTVGTSFATTIASTLNSIPVATGSVNLNSQKITSLATPTVSTDAANKSYVDAQVSATSSCAQVQMTVNTTTTSCVANTLIKIAGTTTASGNEVNFTTSSNRITYSGSSAVVGIASASISFYGTADYQTIGIAITKNGSTQILPYQYNTSRFSGSAYPVNVSISGILTSLSPTDYLEVWIVCGATASIKVNALTLSFASS